MEVSQPLRGARDQRALRAESAASLDSAVETVAEMLSAHGYRTAFFGKWHLGQDVGPGSYGFEHTVLMNRRAPRFQESQRLMGEVLRFLATDSPDPIFLCFWDPLVHTPYATTPALRDKYERKAQTVERWIDPDLGGMVEQMDEGLGRLLNALDASGRSANTLLVFTSDNGGALVDTAKRTGIGPAELPTATSNWPLRGGKGQLYEGGIRVPLVVAWPARLPGGAWSEVPVHSADLAPTLHDVAGVAATRGGPLDGVSWWPLLRDGGEPEPRALFWHFPHYNRLLGLVPTSAVRVGTWKLLRFWADRPDQTDRYELYDLREDPGEARDLAGRHPARVKELSSRIDRHLERVGGAVPTPNPAYDPDLLIRQGWLMKRGRLRSPEQEGLRLAAPGGDVFLWNHFRQPFEGSNAMLEVIVRSSRVADLWASYRMADGSIATSAPVSLDTTWQTATLEFPERGWVAGVRLRAGAERGAVELEIATIRVRDGVGAVVASWNFETP